MAGLDSALSSVATPEDVGGDDGDDKGTKITIGGEPTTTEEARAYSRKFLDKALAGSSHGENDDVLKDIETNAEAAKAALRSASQKLLAARISPQEQAFARAQAWLAPTRTGNFGDTLSNVAGAYKDQYAQQRQQEATAAQQEGQLGQQLFGIDSNTLQARQALAKLREQQEGELAKTGLQQLGRPLANAKGANAAAVSKYGKIAADMGLPPGSPEYTAKVRELQAADQRDADVRAGADEKPMSFEDKLPVAMDAGVPADVPDPYATYSTKQRTAAMSKDQGDATKRISGYGAADASTQAAMRGIDEFVRLNSKTHTGPELAPLNAKLMAGTHGVGIDAGDEHGGLNLNPFSWFKSYDPNVQTMAKDASQVMGLAIPEKGFGRVTNMDMGIFKQGMLGIDKSPITNNRVAQALKIRLQNDLDRHDFDQNYYAVHGHMRGVDAQWNRYLNANPIFDPATAKDKEPKLNPNRKDYQTYFREENHKKFGGGSDEGGPLPAGVTQADLDDPTFAGMSPEEIAGSKVPAHARGGRVGYADGGSVDDSDDYRRKLAALKAGLTLKGLQSSEDPSSPGQEFALEGAGAATGAAGLGLLASRLRGRLGLLGKGVEGLGKLYTEHPHLAASATGATAGGIAGAQGSQDDNPTFDALGGATAGAMLGPLVRGGTSVASGRLAALADKVKGDAIGPGARKTIQAIQGDNPDWNNVAAGLRRDAQSRVPSTIGDSVGPRTTGLATAAIGKDTPGSAAYADQLSGRQADAGARVGEQINQALAPDPYLQKQQQLKDALYTNAKPLYQQAYAQFPAVKSQALMQIMDRPSGQEAAMRAARMMQDEGVPIGKPDATGMVQAPSLQYLDYVKRAFDDMITGEEGVGPGHSATQQGRVLRGMRKSLVSEMDTATVDPQTGTSPYAEARKTYAGDLEVSDALRSGREDFTRLTPEELQAKVTGMSYAEKDAFKSGVAEGLFQKLNNTSHEANAAKRIVGTPGLQQKLSAIFDKPSDATKFLGSLEREQEMFDASKPLLKAAGKGQAEAGADAPSLMTLARKKLMRSDTADEISGIMATPSPQAAATLKRLQGQADRLRNQQRFGNFAGQAAAVGAATGVTPTPQPEEQP